jgi:hypothetical protein
MLHVHTTTGRLGSNVSQKGDILINGRRQKLAYGTSVSYSIRHVCGVRCETKKIIPLLMITSTVIS